jgi:para-aminobenzoate synthetase component I
LLDRVAVGGVYGKEAQIREPMRRRAVEANDLVASLADRHWPDRPPQSSLNAAGDSPMIEEGLIPVRPRARGCPVTTRDRPAAIHQVLDVPADRLAAVVGSWAEPAILESALGFGEAGRWSFYTARPRLVFEATGYRWSITTPKGTLDSGEGDALDALARLAQRYRLADPAHEPDPALPPFQGGLVGFIGYDLAPQLERLPRRSPRDSRMPDIRMALYDTVIAADLDAGRVHVLAWDLTGEGRPATQRRCLEWSVTVETAVRKPSPIARESLGSSPLVSSFGREPYLAAVRRVLEYIAAGDVYQVNLSQRFSCQGAFDPLDLYLRLHETSPAPFAAFLRWGDLAVVSASPEWFYQTRGDRIVTRPIKGTRPRGRTEDEDARLAAELAASPKDRAELTMIVDLERNDLGRVCRYGSVIVRDALRLESFAQVHHLVATVEGRIRPGVGPADVVRAMFPGGSITGAPKIRAMQIIDELEPHRRSLYTGAIGYLGRGGSSAFNIAIRTILVEGDRASYQVGGGIVADSDPEAEYEETLAKGRAMRAVLEGQGGSSRSRGE